jgi:hypothetical protein
LNGSARQTENKTQAHTTASTTIADVLRLCEIVLVNAIGDLMERKAGAILSS